MWKTVYKNAKEITQMYIMYNTMHVTAPPPRVIDINNDPVTNATCIVHKHRPCAPPIRSLNQASVELTIYDTQLDRWRLVVCINIYTMCYQNTQGGYIKTGLKTRVGSDKQDTCRFLSVALIVWFIKVVCFWCGFITSV